MASLFTNHDILNIHKILGFGCLAHYGYRFVNKYLYDSMYFTKDSIYTYVSPLVHLGLSLSSFVFQVPHTRFDSKVIIWKELQLHNIIFTSRSIFMMYHTLFFKPDNYFYYYSRLAIMLSHHYLADVVSEKYKNKDKTATRNIPYEMNNGIIEYFLKKFYAISQLTATFNLTLSNNYENGFLIMFPVQLSAFLMTLVRKNIISNKVWHIFYALSLTIPYLANLKSYHLHNENIHYSIIFIVMRLLFKMDKYLNMIGLTYFYTHLSKFQLA